MFFGVMVAIEVGQSWCLRYSLSKALYVLLADNEAAGYSYTMSSVHTL